MYEGCLLVAKAQDTADTAIMRWADPPTVELRLSAEARIDAPHAQPVLDDFIDMSPLS